MKLQLHGNKVNQLIFVDAEDRKLDTQFGLSFEPVFNDESVREFKIVFDFEYITEEGKYLRVDYHSVFTTDSDIGDDFITSKFPIINAPAIAFPFLRAFVANYLISSGFQPVLLPSVNFVNFVAEEISKPS
ncbi:protein-export chaperone SecB [Enterobacter hormaechei]|uniref:protein-export chaperone SecB n=1 Tax=Enterobacter cloacae complex TaxID=354276 RepID=UPI0013FDD926|nr:protein-export chaperone SecB [Enterobacter hormaechei]ELN4418080.1 protein-export chaperone SecB [Enterobacter hormaechei]MDR9942269.1 protein-export chaperone SecB [Enterobacter hormaechei subsp. xiangfangensis]MDV5527797.1 protein-export chaperone SecB [Enterobacter hormaechei]HBM2703567.1 protein-export chaperone SecB [Enterobacter hormaechei subsp. xiangfangensis]HCM9102209.1 protein-export chaperone SecB [Enterobacter hormaechei subsp. steigerwaltii]